MGAIVTRDLTKIYRGRLGRHSAPAVDKLNLEICQSEVFGFLGRNGAGKTTTIKILCSLLSPTSGVARVYGEDIRRRKTRRLIGYLPENPYFYEYLTPRETLDFYGRLEGLSALERADEWDRLAELLELGPIADQRVRTFSKGMRQRLGFAVALVGDPPALILDEPMTGLDPLGRRAVRELILYLGRQGKTIFFSSHVLGDVEQICNRVGILVKGKLLVQGRLDTLLKRRITRIEVVATNLDDSAAHNIAATAAGARRSEAGHHFHFDKEESANAAVKAIHAAGGALFEFTPVKESLEDYFMRRQEEEECAS